MRTMRVFGTMLLATALGAAMAWAADPAPRLPDSDKLVAMLMARPDYKPYRPPGSDAEDTFPEILIKAAGSISTPDDIKYGKFNGDGGIDTPEEFFTAMHLVPFQDSDAVFRAAFAVEFPAGREGCLRLACLWFKYGALSRTHETLEEAAPAIGLVLAAAGQRGFALTRDEALTYYRAGLRAELVRVFGGAVVKHGVRLVAGGLARIVDLWYAHFAAPHADRYHRLCLEGNVLAALAAELPDYRGLLAAWDGAVKAFGGDGFAVNYTSDRDNHRLEDEDGAAARKRIAGWLAK